MGRKLSGKNRGFTLIEVMIAMLVVGLAVSALLVRMAGYVDSTAYLRDKSIAQWVALNQLTLERLANQKSNRLVDSEKTGSESMAGREWFWRLTPVETGAEGFVQLEVTVFRDAAREDPVATIIGYIDSYHRLEL